MASYIHGTSPEEQARLNALNALTNRSFISYLGELSGKDVADFGCGTGLSGMALRLGYRRLA